jgi:hypothetical protein
MANLVSCDALAFSTINTGKRPKYGQTCANFFERFSQVTYVLSIAGILEDASQFERRIKMIARFKKNSYQWSPLAVIVTIMLGCVSLPDAEHKEAAGISVAKPLPATKVNMPAYRLVLDDQIAGIPIDGTRYFSPSGDRIAFRSQDKLYIADQNGTVIRPILDDPGPWKMRGANWSPDGRLVVYMGTREVTSQSGTHNVSAIFIISPDGGGPRQIGPEVRGDWWVHRGLKWTPDGRHLSYSNPRTGGLQPFFHSLCYLSLLNTTLRICQRCFCQ